MLPDGCIDVHQHLWPPALLEALRARTAPPMLRGWTLHTAAEPPYEVRPDDHNVLLRSAREAGRSAVLVSLSTPLGIEALPADDAAPLLDAWHEGVRALPTPFRGWAAVGEREPDIDGLTDLLKNGFVGLQVSATAMLVPAAIEALGPVLRRCEELDRPVLVHPGPVHREDSVPGWWAAVVQYPAQLQAAWWAWSTAGPALFPDLRICFGAGAGLAPLHFERFAARGGGRFTIDRNVFVDTSSYGRQAVDHLTRALGIDPIVLGSDRPYAEPVGPKLGDAALRAIAVTNPLRLLEGSTP